MFENRGFEGKQASGKKEKRWEVFAYRSLNFLFTEYTKARSSATT